MKNYFVTFFINGSYNTKRVEANSEKEAENIIRGKYQNANLITVHKKLPTTR